MVKFKEENGICIIKDDRWGELRELCVGHFG